MAVVQDNKSTRTVSIAATATNIIAHSFCRRILVGENFTSAAGPTTDLAQKAPAGASVTEIIVLKGTPAVFTAAGGPNGQYTPGQIVGSVRVLDVAGPVTCQQIENQLI
jgi:hypothetical protein